MDGADAPQREVYVHPRIASEFDRLDILHFALKDRMGGHNYLVPLETVDRVLDVGSGTGRWAQEVCLQFPTAVVVALDVVPGRPATAPNFHFVQGNVLQGLPFPDGQFDYVHQRLLVSGIPVRRWHTAVADLVRVTRQGGWVELCESMPYMEPEGDATRRLFELLRQVGRSVGLDTVGNVQVSLGRYLCGAGAEGVQVRTLTIPIGDWAGQVGSLMATEFRAVFAHMVPTFAKMGLAAEESDRLMRAMTEEFEALRPWITFKVAYGQRSN